MNSAPSNAGKALRSCSTTTESRTSSWVNGREKSIPYTPGRRPCRWTGRVFLTCFGPSLKNGRTVSTSRGFDMNNVILSCLALTSAGVLWLSQRNSLEAARANQRVLQQELAAAQQTLADTSASVAGAQNLLALRRQELDWARRENAAKSRIAFRQ